jgi:hypothetical protein
LSRRALGGFLVLITLTAAPAGAIPAFARKYQTSCLTCHTVYPKLNPFGEAFRRTDSDYIKAEQVALGQEANKKTFPKTAWPDSILAAIPISVGANGQALVIPSSGSSAGEAAKASDGSATHFTLQDLAAEAHIWGGAAFDDTVAVFDYESAKGFPTTAAGPQAWQGGATPWGPLQIAPPSSGETNRSEFESIGLYLAWAM